MRFYLFLFLFFWGSLSLAQTTILPKQVDQTNRGILYSNEWSVDLRFHTNGLSVSYNKAQIRTFYKTSYYQFELGYLKDPREIRQDRNIVFQNGEKSRRFALGKQNNVFVMRAGVGRKYYLSEKSNKNGVAIGYSYQFGGGLALLKPYYLELIYRDMTDGQIIEIKSEKYSTENAEVFTNYDQVIGSSGFWKGVDEISVVPGGQAKAALHFALGAYDKNVKAIEVGIMADFFLKALPIMVETDEINNKPYFINLYVNLQLGKRSL